MRDQDRPCPVLSPNSFIRGGAGKDIGLRGNGIGNSGGSVAVARRGTKAVLPALCRLGGSPFLLK